MANALYDGARADFLTGALNWASDTIKAILVTSGYTPNLSTDGYLSSVPSGDRIAAAVALTGKTTAAGVAGASTTVFPAVASGSTVQAVVVYKDTGTEGTSRLIAYYDTAPDGSLPKATNGGDVDVAWPMTGTPPGLFQL